MLYAVIVAGGQGTRLWPVSRKSTPKQLSPFAGGESLLQRTYKRIAKLVPHERIYIETNADYADEFLRQLPELTPDRLILEPEGKNNGPAVGLAAAVLGKIDPEAVMVNVWSDHYYEDEDGYREMVKLAEQTAEKFPDYLLGIQAIPTFPAIGFGYLEAGEEMDRVGEATIYRCARFVEKPDLETAKKYLASGRFYWNTASFVWKVSAVLDNFKKLAPEMYEGLMKMADAWGTPNWKAVVEVEFAKFPSIGFDYLISEKTDKMAFIPARIGWSDVGSWGIIHEILGKLEETDVVTRGKVVTVGAENSLIFNENPGKLVAVVGVDDLVVVDTPDALLVMKKSQDQEIKKLTAKIAELGETEYL